MINTLLKRRMENTKKNKKGFTLVELIVVLVIIAILAAVLVPTMSSYIGKAKKTAVQSSCKTVVTAAAAAGTDLIASNGGVPDGTNISTALTNSGITSSELSKIKSVVLNKATGAVVYVDYVDGQYECVYKDDKYTSDKSSAFATGKPHADLKTVPTGDENISVLSASNQQQATDN